MRPNQPSPPPYQMYTSADPSPHSPPNPASDQSLQVDARIETIDVKLAKLTSELTTYQQRLSRMRDGPGKNAIKQKRSKSCSSASSTKRKKTSCSSRAGTWSKPV